MSTSAKCPLSSDAQSALVVCQRLLSSMIIGGDEGRKQFESVLHPKDHMANGRYFRGQGIMFHSLIPELGDYMTDAWANPGEYNEEIDGDATVLVDHDLAMVWTPFWFRVKGEITHVDTNCFNLIKVYEDEKGAEENSKWEWKVMMICDTARAPTDEERKRLDEEYQRRL